MARYGWLALGITIVAAILLRTSLVDAYVTSKARSSQAHETLPAADSGDAPMLGDAADESVTQHKSPGSDSGSVQADASGAVWADDGTWGLYNACSQIESRILSESGELTIAPIENDLCESSLHRQSLLTRHLEIARETSGAMVPSYFVPGYDDIANSPVVASNTVSPFDGSSAIAALPDYYVSRGFHGAFAPGGGGGGGGKSNGTPDPAPSGSDGSTPNVPTDSNPPVSSNPGGSDPVGSTPGGANPPVNNNPPTDYNPPVNYDPPLDPVVPIDPPPVPGATVPEPETLGLLGFALLGMFFASRRRPLVRSV